jgi:ADP-ribose pyrophosphatase YjhB (NUDIX family)
MDVTIAGPDAVLIGRYGTSGDFTINFYYRAISISGQPVPADDVAELRWFPLDDLPTELAYDHERRLLSQLATAKRGGQLP